MAEYNERASYLGRSVSGTAGSSDVSSCESDDSRLLVAKVQLGKGIRDLAEANHRLSCALAGGASQEHVGELAVVVEQLLQLQNDCLGEINSLA